MKDALSQHRGTFVLSTLLILFSLGIVVWRQQPAFREPPLVDASPPEPAPTPESAFPGSTSSPEALPTDIDQAWSVSMSEADEVQRREMLLQLARRTAARDILRALDWVQHVADAELQLELRRTLLARWARTDGAAAMLYAQSLTESAQSLDLVTTVLRAWAEAAPVEAIRWFAQASETGVAAQTTAALAESLARQPAERISELITSLDSEPVRTALCHAVVQYWKDDNPADAANLIVSATTGQPQTDLLGEVVPLWSQRDLQGAVQWMRELSSGPGKEAALVHASYEWVRTDPAEAAAFARDLPAGHEQFLTALASQWVRLDPQAASAWAQQLSAGLAREKVLPSLAAAWAQHDPIQAVEFVQRLSVGAAKDNALVSVIAGWAAKDPAAAIQWAAILPEGGLRDYAVENVFYRWTEADPMSAVARLAVLPAGSTRDIAIHAGAGSLIESHPDLAAPWAALIGNEALRNLQMERAAQAWLTLDATGAQSWIAQSSLPAAVKQRLLQVPAP